MVRSDVCNSWCYCLGVTASASAHFRRCILIVCLLSFCVFKCLFKTLLQEETNSHWLHLSDFSPVCVFKWVFKMPVCMYVGMNRRLLQGSYKVESCAPASPPSYTSSSPAYSSLALHIGRLCSVGHHHVFQGKGRTLCFSISLPFGVVHGQVLLYVGHHQVLHMNLSCKHIHFHF